MRDITLEETVYFNFTTRAFSTGVPTTLGGTPALSVLESNNATPITSGVSLSVDRASVTGLHQATVVATAANGYEAGKSYAVYISTGTVGGVSVVGEVVAQFTIQTAASFTRLGAPAGASVSADIAAAKVDTAAIKVKTDFLPSATAGASGGVFIAGTNAATTITTALTTTFTGNLTGSVASVTGAVGSVTGNVGGNVTGSVGSVATGGITSGSIAADAIGASELAADAVAEISAAVWAEATRTLTAGTNIVLAKGVGVTGFNDLSAAQVNAEVDTALADVRLDELLAADSDIDGAAPPTVGSVFHELMSKTTGSFTFDQATDSLEALRDNTGTAGAGLTAVPWNSSWDAEVQSEVQDAIEVNHLDHLLAVTYDPASKPGASDALLNELVESDAGVARFTANALEQAPTGGSAPTAAAIADAVWDEALSGHLSAGSTGEALNAAGAAGDPWTTSLPGAYSSGQAGYIIGTNVNATISSRASQVSLDTVDDFLDTEIAAIKAKTDNLPASPAATGDIPSAATNASTLLAAAVEGSVTVVQSLRLANAANGGKASGMETTAVAIRDLGDTKDRITAAVDADGNRDAVTLDLT